MPIEGYSPEACLDFDFSVVEFWEWVEARQAERRPVPETSADKLPNRGDGWKWGPRYESMNQIFDLFMHGDDDALDPDVAEIDITKSLTTWANEKRVGMWDEE